MKLQRRLKNEKSNRNRCFGGVHSFFFGLCKYEKSAHRRQFFTGNGFVRVCAKYSPEESSAASVSESKESSEQSTPTVKAETSQAQVSSSAAVESSKVEVQPTTDESRPQKTEPPKTDTPEPVTPQPTKPAENPAASEPPQETAPPIKEEPTAPTFNIQTWIDFAVGYAESVGLNVSPDATACWDNPITAGSHSMYLERDIQSRLNRYSRDGESTDVWIWAEERSDGSYDLYIGYA